jgi:hypothetical protein
MYKDVDPLADTTLPRHAVESEEEEDFDRMDRSPTIEADVKVVGFVGKVEKLLIVTGDAGNFWSKGANLGTHSAKVTVNAVEVI